MGDLIRAIDQSFQRILRWFYPGFLLMTLFYMSKPNDFRMVLTKIDLVPMLIVFLTLGALLFLLEHSVIHEILCALRQLLFVKKGFCKYRTNLAVKAKNSKGKEQCENRSNTYENYIWSVQRATLISSLAIFFFLAIKDSSSIIGRTGYLFLILGIAMLIGSIYTYFILAKAQDEEENTKSDSGQI